MVDAKQEIPDDVHTITADDGTVWVEIASTGTHDEAALLQGFLENEEIPAQLEDLKFEMEPVNFGGLGEIRVYVPHEHQQRAKELLALREQEYEQLDDDEETLITDDGQAVVDETAQVEDDDGPNP
jgi:hypothetical protein